MKAPLPVRLNYLYISGLALLGAAMLLSMFVMSIAQFVLAAAFLFEGNVLEKLKRFLHNKAAVVIASIFLLHLIGMLWTDNTAEGWKDIRVKIPLLALTVMIAGSQAISHRQFQLIVAVFASALLAGTFISTAVIAGLIPRDLKGDIRNVMIFNISHIRFSLMLCTGIFALGYFAIKANIPMVFKILSAIVGIWFIVFLVILESLTGLSILLSVNIDKMAVMKKVK